MSKSKMNVHNLVLLALLTAIVIVLQLLGAFVRFGPFSISLVLMPIVVGAALISPMAGGWLGFVFGLIVLATGDANVFLSIDPLGTVVVVIIKGIVAGLLAGFAYRAIAHFNKTAGAIAAAALCPVGNTGVFILGVYLFFLPVVAEWGMAEGFENVTAYIFLGMIGMNFIIELAINLLLCPVIVRLVQYAKNKSGAAA
jgi:uncharacterized membrane protein